MAEDKAGEKLDSLFGRLLVGPDAIFKEGIAPSPEFFRDNGLDLRENPLFLGLKTPGLSLSLGFAVVGSTDSLG